MGTYIHGILDNPEFIDFLLEPFAGKLSEAAETFNYRQFKEEQYDKLRRPCAAACQSAAYLQDIDGQQLKSDRI